MSLAAGTAIGEFDHDASVLTLMFISPFRMELFLYVRQVFFQRYVLTQSRITDAASMFAAADVVAIVGLFG